ncbi:MAG: hypothetical protein NXY57DRAFT_1039174 [Lentinula lateritia]|nr:MAG: hypothetical protein NXY57DRAFT_1039174 [Lentinula lateritia]
MNRISISIQWLTQIKFARVIGYLAVKIFSITINSMADERTNSMITWFNSPYQGHQTSQTVESMVMVGQWYRRHDEASKVVPAPRKHPVVKFFNLDKTYLKLHSDKSEDNEEDEEKQSKGEKEAQMPKKRGCKNEEVNRRDVPVNWESLGI